MILYHATTTYQLLCCITHKLAYHRKTPAMLMLLEYLHPKDELDALIDRMKRFDWFAKIVIVPERLFKTRRKKY